MHENYIIVHENIMHFGMKSHTKGGISSITILCFQDCKVNERILQNPAANGKGIRNKRVQVICR